MKYASKRTGFTLVEVLMALAISAILLTAVAVAFNASIHNYQENQELYDAVHGARQAMSLMTTQLRTCNGVDLNKPVQECEFLSSTNEVIAFEYRSADDKLVLVKNGTDYDLCHNVVAAEFIKMPTADGTKCKAVRLTLGVDCGGTVKNLASAVAIRRNMEW